MLCLSCSSYTLLFNPITIGKILLIIVRPWRNTIIFSHIFGFDLFCFRFTCCSGEATADLTRYKPPAVVVVVLYRCAETLYLS